MQGVAGKMENLGKSRTPSRLDKLQVTLFVWPVNLITNQRISEVREMHPDLVGTTGLRYCSDNRKRMEYSTDSVSLNKALYLWTKCKVTVLSSLDVLSVQWTMR